MSARETKTTGTTAKTLKCPHCINAALTPRMWGGVEVSICMRCGANYFASGALAAWEGWTDDVPAAAAELAERREAKFLCPGCSKTMEQLIFPLTPPLELDRCPACHAILLDFEEIRRVPEVGAWAVAKVKSRTGR